MFFGNRQFTTVDIGSYSIKAVKMMRKKNKLNIIDTAIIELPPETLKNGEIVDISIVGSELKTLFEKMRYHPQNIITTIANNNLLIRNLEVPVMSEDELFEAIKWEADDQLPFPVEQAKFDYIVINRDEEKVKVLLVAVKKEIIENFIAPFTKIGLKPRVLNVQPMALLSLLEYQGKLNEPAAVLNIGNSATQVTIGSKDNIHLSRTIDTGGKDFTATIREGLGLNYQEAEDYKREKGIKYVQDRELDSDEPDLDSLQIAATNISAGEGLNSLAGSLADEISRSLDFFSMKNRGEKVQNIYITGGGSKLEGIKDIISEEINREIFDLDTFKDIEIPETGLPEKEMFSVAVGLGISEVLANEG